MTKRRKDLEYEWIFKDSFFVYAYTVKLENGKTYIIYSNNFDDASWFLTRLEVNEAPVKCRPTDSGFVTKRECISYLTNKNGELIKRPFWHRGRVYEVADN